MKKAISSRVSSWPSRFLWMTSTARMAAGLFLLEALDLGPEVAALLDGHRGRARGIRRGRHAGQDLVHQALVVVLLLRAAGRDLAVPVVVGVEAGPAGDLGDLAPGEAGDVVIEQEATPCSLIDADTTEPERPVRHEEPPEGRRRPKV